MNCHEAVKLGFVRLLKSYIQIHQVKIMAVIEIRISGKLEYKVSQHIGFERSHRVEAQGFSDGIYILQRECISMEVLRNDWQYVIVEIPFKTQQNFVFTIVYASSNSTIRRDLQKALLMVAYQIEAPWLMVGDFNEILNPQERSNGEGT